MKKKLLILASILFSWQFCLAQSIGGTEGVFDVSDLGGANYTIPIKVPDGLGGLQPTVSLNYNSQGENGIMGMGWSLSAGSSVITRIPNTIYNDKMVSGVSLAASDKFALDGNRLILTSGTYGMNASTYATESESFKSITANGSQGSGPQSFTITDQNGLVFEYGITPLSRPQVAGKIEPYMWLLDKVTDLNGNYIEYKYSYNAGEEPRLSFINYSGNIITGMNYQSTVYFFYESKPDPNVNYVGGGGIHQLYRLKSLHVRQRNAGGNFVSVRTFHLSYTTEIYTHLTEVKETGHELNGTPEELNPTTFAYGTSTTASYQQLVGAPQNTSVEFAPGDYNGDGKTDLIQYSKNYNSGTNIWNLYLNVGNAFTLTQTGSLPPAPSQYNNNETIYPRNYTPTFSDFNGDGKDDFLYLSTFFQTATSTFPYQKVNIMTSNGTSLSPLAGGAIFTKLRNTTQYMDYLNKTLAYPADFDGDGKFEVLLLNTIDHNPLYVNDWTYNNYLVGNEYLQSGTYNGQAGLLAPTLLNMPFDAAYVANGQSKIMVVDYDGDGKSEILSIWRDNATQANHAQVFRLNVTYDANNKPVLGNPAFVMVNEASFPTLDHEIFTADFNGDGITDLLTYISSVGWEVCFGKGNGQMNDVAPGPVMNKPKDGYFRPLLLADFNGDGKTDIYDYTPAPSQQNWGAGHSPRIFYATGKANFVVENPSVDQNNVGSYNFSYWLGDYNGDGSADFLTSKTASLYTYCFHPDEKRHLLSSIQRGWLENTKVKYETLTSGIVYQPGSNTYTYPYIKRTLPFKVVSTVNTDNGVDATGNDINYSYTGLKSNAHGKGLMGFDMVSSFDVANSIIIEKNFSLNTTYAYPNLQSVIVKQGTNMFNAVTVKTKGYTHGVYHYGNTRIFPYVTQINSNDYVNNTVTSETYNYTAPSGLVPVGTVFSTTIGKPMTVTTDKGNGAEVTTQSFSFPPSLVYNGSTFTSTPVYVYSKPQKVTTTTTRIGQPAHSRIRNYAYSTTNGLMTRYINDPGTANAATTDFYNDIYGNPVQKIISASGQTPRYNVLVYDPTHRYITETYNQAFPTIKAKKVYEPVTGNLIEETAPDGLTKNYTYDGFGRLITLSDNNGSSGTNYFGWAFTGSPANTTYWIHNVMNTGEHSWKYYDRLGREVYEQHLGINGQWIYTRKIFNNKGQVASTTKPSFVGGTSPQSISYTYDIRGRLTQEAKPEGNNTYTYLISGNNYTVTATNTAGQAKKTTTDKSGRTVTVEDNGGILYYTYHSCGETKNVSLSSSGTVSAMEYDSRGLLTQRTDPNYGTYNYSYNPYGEMISQQDPKGNVYNFTYDQLGLILTKTGPEGAYQYTYETTAGPSCGKLIQMSGPEGVINYLNGLGNKVYEIEQKHIPSGEIFTTKNAYDSYGRLSDHTFPNGVSVGYKYSPVNGDLFVVENANGDMLYGTGSKNALGEVTSYVQNLGTSIPTTLSYDSFGFLTDQKTEVSGLPSPIVRHSQYNFDPASGNLLWRKDLKYGLTDGFSYDNLNRLTGVSSPSTANNISYSNNGNILVKDDAGTFVYDQANRLSEINNFQNIPHTLQDLTFTPFNKVATIGEDPWSANFSYWPDGERSRMELMQNGSLVKTKFYAPGFEKEIDAATGIVREICYVAGPDGNIVAILEHKNGTDKTYFVLTDHLGSYTQILDINGNIVEEKSYDAWGRLRDPQTWIAYASNLDAGQPAFSFDRGYTGHEHLPEFGIVNMNGRLYDPVTGRMFAPDPYIMGNNNTQGYNRYSYALNNPLIYTDPDGHVIVLAPILAAVIYGAVAGAATSAIMYSVIAGSDWKVGGLAKAALFGAIAGAVSAGIGSAAAAAGSSAFFQSAGFNILKNTTGQVVANLVTGNGVSLNTIAGGIAGGLVMTALPGFTGVEGGAFSNIVGELAQAGGAGGAGGFVSGAVTAGLSGQNILDGAFMGLDNGIKSGLGQSGFWMTIFGPGIVPDIQAQNEINRLNKHVGVLSPGKYGPVFRRGGLYSLLTKRGVAWGRNLVVPDEGHGYRAYVHEYVHYLQEIYMGFGLMQAKGIQEQAKHRLFGIDPYKTPGTNEYEANWFDKFF